MSSCGDSKWPDVANRGQYGLDPLPLWLVMSVDFICLSQSVVQRWVSVSILIVHIKAQRLSDLPKVALQVRGKARQSRPIGTVNRGDCSGPHALIGPQGNAIGWCSWSCK